jgi:hypothetical protein
MLKTVLFQKNADKKVIEFTDKIYERVRKGKNLPTSLQPRKKVVDIVGKSYQNL